MKREPILILGLIEAVIQLVAAFGLDLDTAQVVAINGVVAMVLAIWLRQQVTPIAAPRLPQGSSIEVYPTL